MKGGGAPLRADGPNVKAAGPKPPAGGLGDLPQENFEIKVLQMRFPAIWRRNNDAPTF